MSDLHNLVIWYEDSIWDGTLKNLNDNEVPHGYRAVFKCNPEAYQFHRHTMVNYVTKFQKSSSLYNEFLQIKNMLENYDSQNNDCIRKYLSEDKSLNKLVDRMSNVRKLSNSLIEKSNGNIEITLERLNYYVQVYEVTEYLRFMVLVIQIIQNKGPNVIPSGIIDRKGNVVKGRILQTINDELSAFPVIREYFSCAYKAALRNSIGHNNYRIKNGNFYDLDGSIEITKSEFQEILFKIQEIQMAIFNTMNLHSIDKNKIRDCGLLTIGYQSDYLGQPILNLFELWSFSDISRDYSWIRKIEVRANSGNIKLKINGRVEFKTLWDKELNLWFERVKDLKSITVRVVTIEPFTSENEKSMLIKNHKYQAGKSRNIGSVPLIIKGKSNAKYIP